MWIMWTLNIDKKQSQNQFKITKNWTWGLSWVQKKTLQECESTSKIIYFLFYLFITTAWKEGYCLPLCFGWLDSGIERRRFLLNCWCWCTTFFTGFGLISLFICMFYCILELLFLLFTQGCFKLFHSFFISWVYDALACCSWNAPWKGVWHF